MTIEPISDERLAEIRRGLNGLPAGPWKMTPWHIEEGPPAVRVAEGWLLCATPSDDWSAHIARMDPPTVAALLARLDKAEADAATARGLLSSLLNGDGPAVVPSPNPTA